MPDNEKVISDPVEGLLSRASSPASEPISDDAHRLLKVLSIREVQRLNSLSRASIYRGIAAGTHPPPIQLTPGGHRVGWREEHIRAWLQDPLGWKSAT